jgi:hypothetical protein
MAVVRRMGPWRLGEKLGEGGIAVVWRAVHETTGATAALKLIHAKKVQSEPYKRFVQEITVLRQLGPAPGILPLLDSHLPEAPSPADPPWLAMPIATPLHEGLSSQPLEEIVRAIRTIATTLADLHSSHGVSHRDIKPDNLYVYEGRYVVGDFGLVSAPELEDLTEPDRPLGPRFFMAYEMMRDPTTADAHLADVYSLAKTLWVFAVGQNFPPPGHQREDVSGYRIRELRPSARADVLDRITDRATRTDPESRPTMRALSDELGAWLETLEPAIVPDLSDLARMVQAAMAHELDAASLTQRQMAAASAAAIRFNQALEAVNDELRAVLPTASINAPDPFALQLAPATTLTTPVTLWKAGVSSTLRADGGQYELKIARSLALLATGELIMDVTIIVHRAQVLSVPDFHWTFPRTTFPVESTLADTSITTAVQQISEQLPAAMRAFVKGLEARRQPPG